MRTVTIQTILFLALVSTPAFAQSSTQAGSVAQGADKIYTFTPADFGQLIATLTWDKASANLIMVLVCGTDSPTAFGIAAGSLDRFARLESGVIGTMMCGIGVSTIDDPANFLLNLQRSGDQASASASRVPSGYAAFGEARRGTLLYDETSRLLAQVKRVRR